MTESLLHHLCASPCPPRSGGLIDHEAKLTNVSLWVDLDAAKQLDRFQPMLDAGKPYVAKGATFERPIMNYTTPWQLQPISKN